MWESPNKSENLTNIHYIVDYLSVFWVESKTLDVFGKNFVIIDGLKSGSKYEFNITVKAGNETSDPTSTTGVTGKEIIAFSHKTLKLKCANYGSSGRAIYKVSLVVYLAFSHFIKSLTSA